MRHGKPPLEPSALALVAVVWMSIAPSCIAITVGQLDDFQDGSTQHWSGAGPTSIADAGPVGIGDFALHATAHGGFGGGGKLVVYNDGFQWDGDWTAAGVARVAMDVRNPNDFPLLMRLGIAGPGRFSFMGTGDTYVSDAISVAADDQWHSITFDVLADDFVPISGADVNTALAGVTHFRILHSPATSFLGAQVSGAFFLDNIRAVEASMPLAGDYNGNGEVDAADYVVWRDNLGANLETGEGADGTGPGGVPDGVVDQLDYDFWRRQFGSMTSDDGHMHGNGLASGVVPEPGTLLLLLTAIAFLSAGVAPRKEPAN